MTLKKETEEQICKDIVRTFPNNIYFERNNSGYYSMFKVLSAYSNLDEFAHDLRKLEQKTSHESRNSSRMTNSTGKSDNSPNLDDRKSYRKKRNKTLRNDLIDSFCELSFSDSTQYVQGMNFVVGILCYHLSPELAFCLFFKLMKDYDLEDNYTPGLSGFKEKSDILNNLIKKHLPKLHEFFVSIVSIILIGSQNDFHRDIHSRTHHGSVREHTPLRQLGKTLLE